MNGTRGIKISAMLLLTLILFALFQIGASIVSYVYLSNNIRSIQSMNTLDDELDALNTSIDGLKNAQHTINNEFIELASGSTETLAAHIAEAEKQLIKAEDSFQQFHSLPDLTAQEPELAKELLATYKDQYQSVNEQLQLLKTNQPVTQMLSQLDELKGKIKQARDQNQAKVRIYIDKQSRKYENYVSESLSSFTIYIYTAITIVVILLILTFLIHFWLRNNLIAPLQKIIQHFQLIETGNLRQELQFNAGREVSDVRDSLNKMQRGLITTVKSVRDGAESISIGTQEIAAGNTDLSSRTEQQAAALTQTAANMEEISATIRQNAENAGQASGMISSTSVQVHEGEELMEQLVAKMHTINHTSRQVSEIIATIDGIAFQTNILALNAAVEAARAGEQGRGFSVVAGEVRSLAQRCATSAKEISQLIISSTSAIEDGVNLAEKAGRSMNDIVGSINKVSPVMEQISMASDEQSRGVEQIRIALGQMDEVTQQNAALVEQVATNASNVESQSVQLVQVVSVFRFDEQSAFRQPPATGNISNAALPSPAAKTQSHSMDDGWSTF